MIFVYLAGPIAGCTVMEAKDWRAYVSRLFLPGIVGVSPLRCEPPNDGKYDAPEEWAKQKQDLRFGTGSAIVAKNKLDVNACHVTLAYLPREINERRPSYGTIMEVGWSGISGKPTILVTDDPYLEQHPVVTHDIGWVLPNLDMAAEVVNGVFGIYAKGA